MSDIKALSDRLRDLTDVHPSWEDDNEDIRCAAAILDHLAAAPGPLREVAGWLWQCDEGFDAVDAAVTWLDGLADLTGEQSDGE